ncbi:MAG: tol-pal system protein YbgF [Thermodesulfobacteriota bacterium]
MRTLERTKRWIILGWVGLLFGCATSEDVRILDDDMRQFQSRLNLTQKEGESLKKDLLAVQENQRAIKKDLSTLRADTDNEMKKIRADLLLRIENIQSDMRILSTGIEEYKDFLKKPAKEIDRVKEEIALRTRMLEERGKTFEEKNRNLEDRVKGLEERLKEAADRFKGLEGKMTELSSKLKEIEKTPPPKETPPESKATPTGIGDLYKDAYETFQRGHLEESRRKFEAFLKFYPNTELSDNAQFWIGETYYLKKDYEKAILEYEKVIVKYPEGEKISAALFKQALAFLELGDKTNARNLLRRVVERYPHSDQAEMARKKLEAIK